MMAEIDLLDRDRFTLGIPHEWFTWLRANAPVFHHDEPGGDGFGVITRYDDVVTANRDARRRVDAIIERLRRGERH